MKTDKKCKDTKRLLKLAKDSGMSNKEIAKKAGLSPKSISMVSRWLNDGVLAYERQMGFFVKVFGEQLRRKSEHLLFIEKDEQQYFIKLTGDLVVKHVVREYIRVSKKQLNIALHRFLIYRKDDSYYLVSQTRKGFDAEQFIDSDILTSLSHCDNEDANWISEGTSELLTIEELLHCVDKVAKNLAEGRIIFSKECIFSGQELQFNIRRHLMREGIQLPDVIDISNQN
ncbi:hypothetical protein [Glaciecola sp. MF2-115]|uniref:hypothetical protein n=1 Tax=Glaciecola sp. MF2-115 TaxID=3384827 RepID=UPI0039A33728